VRNYNDLVALLVSKAPAAAALPAPEIGIAEIASPQGSKTTSGYWIRVAELPFEGKNKVVFGAPYGVRWHFGNATSPQEDSAPTP
jgi:hypothetical protein